jgi:small subunit ribosomal protein S2
MAKKSKDVDIEKDIDAELDKDLEKDIELIESGEVVETGRPAKSESKPASDDRRDKYEQQDNFLVPRQTYLASGIHIGMKQKFEHMRQFIYKVRPDGLAVMNLQMIDDRIRTAAKAMAKARSIVIVSRKNIAFQAVEKFSELTGSHKILGRFMPGTLTNPSYKSFVEADIVLIIDPVYDYQALKEAETARIPIFSICGTSNETNGVDFILPANNKSAKALATLFWLLAREILKARGELKSDEDYKAKVTDFFKEGVYEGEGDRYGMGSQEFPDDSSDRGISRRTRDSEREERRPVRRYRKESPAGVQPSKVASPSAATAVAKTSEAKVPEAASADKDVAEKSKDAKGEAKTE